MRPHFPAEFEDSPHVQAAILSNRWFASLPHHHKQKLLDHGYGVHLRNGQHFSAMGQSVRKRRDGLGLLLRGQLKLASSSLSGKEALLGYIKPGQWFGELALLDGQGRERDFVAMGESQVWVIEPEALQRMLHDAELLGHLVRLLAIRTRALLALVEDFTLRTALARTARRLVMLAYDDEPQNGAYRSQLDLSQDALASMLGLTRQSVASQVRELTERGAVMPAYGRIHVVSMVALMAEAAAT